MFWQKAFIHRQRLWNILLQWKDNPGPCAFKPECITSKGFKFVSLAFSLSCCGEVTLIKGQNWFGLNPNDLKAQRIVQNWIGSFNLVCFGWIPKIVGSSPVWSQDTIAIYYHDCSEWY